MRAGGAARHRRLSRKVFRKLPLPYPGEPRRRLVSVCPQRLSQLKAFIGDGDE